jgi:hypothetical protein
MGVYATGEAIGCLCDLYSVAGSSSNSAMRREGSQSTPDVNATQDAGLDLNPAAG